MLDEALVYRRFSRGNREIEFVFKSTFIPIIVTVFCKLRFFASSFLARCALLHPFNYTRINTANSFRLHRSYSNLFETKFSICFRRFVESLIFNLEYEKSLRLKYSLFFSEIFEFARDESKSRISIDTVQSSNQIRSKGCLIYRV